MKAALSHCCMFSKVWQDLTNTEEHKCCFHMISLLVGVSFYCSAFCRNPYLVFLAKGCTLPSSSAHRCFQTENHSLVLAQSWALSCDVLPLAGRRGPCSQVRLMVWWSNAGWKARGKPWTGNRFQSNKQWHQTMKSAKPGSGDRGAEVCGQEGADCQPGTWWGRREGGLVFIRRCSPKKLSP